MKIIREIIKWFINLFRRVFGCRKIKKRVKSSINNYKNKHYIKVYGINNASDDFPIYLMINDLQKESLIDKLKIVEMKVSKDSDSIGFVKKIIKNIENNDISFYQNGLILEKIDNIIQDKKIEIDTSNKIITLDKEIIEILENYDKNVKDKTKKEYGEVNYITLTTLLLDETKDEIEKLEDDYRHHKYNKYYYEREIKKIKMRLNNLMTLKNNESVKNEIEMLKKNLYIKKKDKYDLLYNDEVFYNFDKECDDLLKKVNRRIIDLKKEKEKQKEDKQAKKEERKNKKEEIKEERELLENILKRFKDMELARKILLLNSSKKLEINNNNEFISHIDSIYFDFVSGEKFKFNYDRNKTKVELVKLLNSISRINCSFNNQEFIPFEHINYSMSDLVSLTSYEKEELDNILEIKYNYEKEKDELNILVQNKLKLIAEKEIEKENKHILVKTNNEK